MNTTSLTSPFTVPLEGRHMEQIFYEDTDFTGYVFHANFLKWEFLTSSFLSFNVAPDYFFFINFDKNNFYREIVGLRLLWEDGQKTPHLYIVKMQLAPAAPPDIN